MKEVKAVIPIFFILLLISFIILFFFQTPVSGVLQIITSPAQKFVFMTQAKTPATISSQQQLQQENNQLRTQLAQMQEIQKDDHALHDQFVTTNPSAQKLLPAAVVGLPQNALLIDKGESDHVHTGEVVVVKNSLVGIITKTTPHISQVSLLTDPSTSFTAQDIKTSAAGIVKSLDGGIIIFDNVDLTEKLAKNDIVETKGNMDAQGHGYPPHLIVGKIVSLDKQASNLFQSAKLQSLVDLSHLGIVFVITQ